MTDWFLDLKNGNDANNGTSWALAKKTVTGVHGVAVAGDRIKIARTSAKNTLSGTWSTAIGQSYITGNAALTDYKTFALGNTLGTRTSYNGGAQGTSSSTWGLYTPRTSGTWSSVWTFTQSATQAANQKFWTWDFGAAQDWSAYQEVYVLVAMAAGTTSYSAYTGDQVVLKFCSDALGDTSLFTFPLRQKCHMAGNTSDWMVAIPGGNLPTNVRSLSFYSGGTPFAEAQGYAVVAIVLCKTASFIKPGNFFYESGSKSWHQLCLVLDDQTSAPKLCPVFDQNSTRNFGKTGTTSVFMLDYFYPTTSAGLHVDITGSAVKTNQYSYWTDWNLATNKANLTWEGGWNTSTDLVDSYTMWSFGGANFFSGYIFRHGTSLAGVTCASTFKNMGTTGGIDPYVSFPYYPTTSSTTSAPVTKDNCIHIGCAFFTTNAYSNTTTTETWTVTNCFSSFNYSLAQYSWNLQTFKTLVIQNCSFWYSTFGITLNNSSASATCTGVTATNSSISFTTYTINFTINNITFYGSSSSLAINTTQMQDSSTTKTFSNITVYQGSVSLNLSANIDMSGLVMGWNDGVNTSGPLSASVCLGDAGSTYTYSYPPYGARQKQQNIMCYNLSGTNYIRGGLWKTCTFTTSNGASFIFDSAMLEMHQCTLGASSTHTQPLDVRIPANLYNCELINVQFANTSSSSVDYAPVLKMFGGKLSRDTVSVSTLDVFAGASLSSAGLYGKYFHNVTIGPYISINTLISSSRYNNAANYVSPGSGMVPSVISHYNRTPGQTYVVTPTWIAESQTTFARVSGGRAWKVTMDGVCYWQCCRWQFATVAVKANKPLIATINVYAASGGKVYFWAPPAQLEATQPELLTNSTELAGVWEELTLTHTPTEDGVLVFYVSMDTLSPTKTVYIDDVSFVQI